MAKWPVQNQTHIPTQKHAEQQDATDKSIIYNIKLNIV